MENQALETDFPHSLNTHLLESAKDFRHFDSSHASQLFTYLVQFREPKTLTLYFRAGNRQVEGLQEHKESSHTTLRRALQREYQHRVYNSNTHLSKYINGPRIQSGINRSYSWNRHRLALKRLHRRGQTREVCVFRLTCADEVNGVLAEQILLKRTNARDMFAEGILQSKLPGKADELREANDVKAFVNNEMTPKEMSPKAGIYINIARRSNPLPPPPADQFKWAQKQLSASTSSRKRWI